jgi:peptide-methionine (S)-S-oxide reductase
MVKSTTETAVFGGGCFWCLEAVFARIQGIERVVSGYSGGARPAPSYEQVCSGATGHAEVIEVTFNPSVRSYRELLELFFAFHDPTTLNRQGPDSGTQYRSVIFTTSPEQREIALDVIARMTSEATFDSPIVTEVVALERFWPAEEYHQQYFSRNPARAYCAAVIAPKVATLRQRYAAVVKSS